MSKKNPTVDASVTDGFGIHMGPICSLDAAGELKQLFKELTITPMHGLAAGERRWVISIRDDLIDPIAALAQSALLASHTPSGQEARQADEAEYRADPVVLSARETVELRREFFQGWREGEIVDLTDGMRDVPADAIGVRKDETAWDGPRTLLFSSAVQAMFSDRAERNRLVSHLIDEDIIVANDSRADTNTYSVQIAGKTRKAYRIRMKALRQALATA